MLFFTGSQRNAGTVLSQQVAAMESSGATSDRLRSMIELALEMRDLLRAGDLGAFGKALHRGWEMKQGISAVISTSAIDQVYDWALGAGALGGKIAGAGGGGFLILYCRKPAQPHVRKALSDLQSLDFRFDWAARVSLSRSEVQSRAGRLKALTMNELRVQSVRNWRAPSRTALARPERRRSITGQRFRGPTRRRSAIRLLGAADGSVKPTLTILAGPYRIRGCLPKNSGDPAECSALAREVLSPAVTANGKMPVFPTSG